MNEILKVVSLTKKYGRDVVALDGIDLTISEGDFVSIQGPSGSGKSTLLNCIGALDKPTEGAVYIENEDISKMSENDLATLRRKKVGFIFQSFNLLPILNAAENVELAMENMGMKKKEMRERSLKLLKTVGLKDRWNHMPKEMSGGEKQRVAIARALANKPSILLADEPTGNLDSKTGKGIVSLLGELNHNLNTTVVIVTHDPKIAKKADRQLYVEDGRIKKDKGQRNEKKILMRTLSINQKMAEKLFKASLRDPDMILKMDEPAIKRIKELDKKEKNTLIQRIRAVQR
jgi:putative ABC transport system ATP-binding protein